MITVDKEKLAAALGFTGQAVVLTNDQECRAARAITDSQACQSAASGLRNAAAWTSDAYKEGIQEGRRLERGEWTAKILRMFGI